MAEQKNKTAPEREIERQVAESGEKDARSTGITKAEQPATSEEIPETAVVVREYAKWTDNDGNFHKVPIDGTTAIREPAHEQHELTVEDRDRLDQAMALKTPRRQDEITNPADGQKIFEREIRNDEVHQELPTAKSEGVKPAQAQKGGVKDSGKELVDEEEVTEGTPARR